MATTRLGLYGGPRAALVVASSGALVGASSLTFSPSSTLSNGSSGALSGSSSLTFSPTSTLTGTGSLSGSSSLSFSPSGALTGTGVLSGTSQITFSPSGTLTGTGALNGTATITFTPAGTLLAGATIDSIAARTSQPLKTRNTKAPTAEPGTHWIMAGTGVSDDKTWLNALADATIDEFESIVIRFYWSELEGTGSGTTSGAFDLSQIRRMLDYCTERGIFLNVMIMWRNFNTGLGDVMPSDLVTNFQLPKSGGYISAIYESTGVVRTRYVKCVQAIIDRFKDHPYFYGIQTNETSGFDDCTAEVYTKANAETQLNNLLGSLVSYCPYVQTQVGWNFLTDSANLAAAKQSWSNIFGDTVADNSPTYRFGWQASTAYAVDDVRYMAHRKMTCTTAGTSGASEPTWTTTVDGTTADNTVVWTTALPDMVIWFPDILFDDWPEVTALDNRVYPLCDNAYSAQTHWLNNVWMHGSMQFDSYLGGDTPDGTIYSCATHPPGASEDWNMHNLFVEARDNLDIRGVIWTFVNNRRYKFDTVNAGKTYGDAVAVARMSWSASYDQGYAD